jgi:predicted transcriptional regulator YdeE
MNFIEKNMDRIVISGINVRTSNEKEDNPETVQITNLWRRFYEEELPKIIPNQTSNFAVYGVYSEFDREAGSDFTVTAGVEIRSDLKENMAFPLVSRP